MSVISDINFLLRGSASHVTSQKLPLIHVAGISQGATAIPGICLLRQFDLLDGYYTSPIALEDGSRCNYLLTDERK